MLLTALRMADKKGIEALSMRNLAQALKVEAMSLYNHVPGKERLLDGLVELVVGELELPAVGGDWQAAMRGRAMTAHRVLMQHPWATMLLVSRMNIGQHAALHRSHGGLSAGSRVLVGDGRPRVEYARRVHLRLHAAAP